MKYCVLTVREMWQILEISLRFLNSLLWFKRGSNLQLGGCMYPTIAMNVTEHKVKTSLNIMRNFCVVFKN